MSRYSGAQQAGAGRLARAQRRDEARVRASDTPRERTRQWRRDKARVRGWIEEEQGKHPTEGAA